MKAAELRAWILSELRWFVASEATRRKKNPEKVVRIALLNRLIDQWEESPWVPVSYDVLSGIADAVHPISGRTPENMAPLFYQMRADFRKVLAPRGLLVDIRRMKIEKQPHGARMLSVSVQARLARIGIPIWARYEWLANPEHPMHAVANALLTVPETAIRPTGDEETGVAEQQATPEESAIAPLQTPPTEPQASAGQVIDIEAVRLTSLQAWFMKMQKRWRTNPAGFIMLALIGLTVFVFSTVYFLQWRAFDPTTAMMEGQTLVMKDAAGRKVRVPLTATAPDQVGGTRQVTTSQGPLYAPEARFPGLSKEAMDDRHIVVTDLSGDGRHETILLIESPNGSGATAKLMAFRPDRSLLWPPIKFDERVSVSGGARFSVYQGLKVMVGDLDGDGRLEIVALLNVPGEDPSLIAIVSNHGKVIGRYFHWGGLNDFTLFDVNGDGHPEVVFCGINTTRINADWKAMPDGASGAQAREYRYWGAVAGAVGLSDFGGTGAFSSSQPGIHLAWDGQPMPENTGAFYARFPTLDWSLLPTPTDGHWNQCDLVEKTSDDSLRFLIQEQGSWFQDKGDLAFSIYYQAVNRDGRLEFRQGQIHHSAKEWLNNQYMKFGLRRTADEMERRLTPVIVKYP